MTTPEEEEPLWQAQTLGALFRNASDSAIVKVRVRFTPEGGRLIELTGRVTDIQLDYTAGELLLICDYDQAQRWDNPPGEPAPSPDDPGHHH